MHGLLPLHTSFRDLGVSDAVIDTLAKRGIYEPFPIQVMVIQDATSGPRHARQVADRLRARRSASRSRSWNSSRPMTRSIPPP